VRPFLVHTFASMDTFLPAETFFNRPLTESLIGIWSNSEPGFNLY
jgi:hypothetical protein